MPKTTKITAFLASPLRKEQVPHLLISAGQSCPEHPSLEAASKHHTAEGEMLADALWQHLPGGTVDQILRRLLERRASLLRVKF